MPTSLGISQVVPQRSGHASVCSASPRSVRARSATRSGFRAHSPSPKTGDAAAVEVKGWHTERFTPSYLWSWPQLFYFARAEATAAVTALLGRDDFRRILVVSRLGDRGREEVVTYANERGVEIMEFAPILSDLIARTPLDRSAGSDAEHMIRVLKTYGFVTEPGSSPA